MRPEQTKTARKRRTTSAANAEAAAARPKADALRVRMYNVLFGDAILVSIFEGQEARHILIDVGNVTGTGGDVDVFQPVIDDVLHELGDQPLDLYVMTHEHMDHVKGLLYTNDQLGIDVKDRLKVRQTWLTASAREDFYDTHPAAKKKKLEAEEATRAVTRFLIARYLEAQPSARSAGNTVDDLIRLLRGRAAAAAKHAQAARSQAPGAYASVELRVAALLLNNDYQSTGECVKFLRGLAGPENTLYVHREFPLSPPPDLLSAQVKIWGPEEDTAVYYGRLRPLMLDLAGGDAVPGGPALPRLAPPPGVDAGAFFDLVEARRRGYAENLLSIDKAANNTSVVFCLEWRGWRLLFPGDAEEKSWAIMDSKGMLDAPVDFLKIGHHGSHNGTPSTKLLDRILPIGDQPRYAAVCTCADVYAYSPTTAVPNEKTLAELRRRCRVYSVQKLPKGGRLDLVFPAHRSKKVVVRNDPARGGRGSRA